MNSSECCPEAHCFEAEAEACELQACDPTLEACCQRDLEQQALIARLKAQLSVHDRSKERLRVAGRVLGSTAPLPLPPPPPPRRSDEDESSDFGSEEEDDEEVGRLRAVRLQELQAAAQHKASLQQQGHGRLTDVPEARLLREAESSAAPVVCHLAFHGSPLDDELDEHLARLAHRYLGTRFLRCAITLRSTLHLMLRTPPGPGLLCFREGSLVGATGIDRLGAPECIVEEAVDKWLRQHRGLLLEQPGSGGSKGGAAAAAARGAVHTGGSYSGSDGEEEEAEEGDDWQQPCEVCGRRYPHQHIRSMYAGDRHHDSGSDSDGDPDAR